MWKNLFIPTLSSVFALNSSIQLLLNNKLHIWRRKFSMGTHEETCFSVGFRMQHKRPSNMLIFVAEFFVINSKEIFQYKNPNIFFPCSIIRRFTLSTQREIWEAWVGWKCRDEGQIALTTKKVMEMWLFKLVIHDNCTTQWMVSRKHEQQNLRVKKFKLHTGHYSGFILSILS